MEEKEISRKIRFIELLVLSGTLIYTLGNFGSEAILVSYSLFLALSILYFVVLSFQEEIEKSDKPNLILHKPFSLMIGFFYAPILARLVSVGPDNLILKTLTFGLYFAFFVPTIYLALMPKSYSVKLLKEKKFL